MKIYYTCKTCEHEFEVDVTPIVPAKLWGPPENCHPEEGGEIDPDACPMCEREVDTRKCHDAAIAQDLDWD